MVEAASLYIHVPFCDKKCPYCHFFVLPNSPEGRKVFLESIQREWSLQKEHLKGKEIISIYFGGGTPSLLSAQEVAAILDCVHTSDIPISSTCEITLEFNPGNVLPAYTRDLATIGINRASIGVQSFSPELLSILGRIHTAEDAVDTVNLLFSSGIANISLDLMYELPYQSITHWNTSLERLRELPISHLSIYNLTFEPNTVFYKKKKDLSPHLPSPEEATAMLDLATSYLPTIGLHRYEISAFAKEGFHSIHNTGYWVGRPFLGIGPSAFSYLEGRRFCNVSNLKKWSEKIHQRLPAHDFTETLDPEKSFRELLAVELRLLRGVDLSGKIVPPALFPVLETLIDKGFLQKKEKILSLTDLGLKFYDTVASEIV